MYNVNNRFLKIQYLNIIQRGSYMIKKILYILIIIMLIFNLSDDCTAGCIRADASSLPAPGITLDCARRYYPPKELHKYIDLLSKQSGSFLQLHLTDNENVGIECLYLGQTVKKAVKTASGAYQNPQTEGLFLSREQIKDLISYAQSKNVELVPEIDAPAHMGGFFALADLSSQDGKDELEADEDGELDLSSAPALKFAEAIYKEYAGLFTGCRYFHIGCDELFSATDTEITSYINLISEYLISKGFTVRMWNDLLTKDTIAKIDSSIQITYWSYDGDTEDSKERAERRSTRISVPELQKLGFQVFLYNSYYLYYVPSDDNDNADDRTYMVDDLKDNWNLRIWDGQSGKKLSSTSNILGASISVWGEDSENYSAANLYKQTKKLYEAMLSKMES